MYKIKSFAALFLIALFAISIYGCKKKCKGEDPRARIINNGTQTVSVQIKTSNGNTVNINNVDPGVTSAYSSYTAGLITFTLKVNGVDYVKDVQMSTCFDYDIAIDQSNVITSVVTDRNN